MADEHDGFIKIQSSLARLLQQVNHQPPLACLVVGFSGGVDSTVLLHALSPQIAGLPVHAVYVNHGLSASANHWQAHCQNMCNTLSIPFKACEITVPVNSRQSLEAEARDERYKALLSYCRQHNGALVLGQHLDDQAETFLLQAKRGAGPKGLSAMPALAYRDGTPVFRPMLQITQQQIVEIATALNFSWIEDESNTDTRFDRNFLRSDVMPLLQKRWPGFTKTVARSAMLCAEQQLLLEEVVCEKLTAVMDGDTLVIPALQSLSVQWQQHIIRGWFAKLHVPMPGYKQMSQILSVCVARDDAQPDIHLAGWHVRRHLDKLYLVATSPKPPAQMFTVQSGDIQDYQWSACGRFCVNLEVQVAFGMPAVTCRMHDKGVSKPLKKWMKEWRIPAWERKNVPVLFFQDVPIAAVTKQRVYYFSQCPENVEISIVD